MLIRTTSRYYAQPATRVDAYWLCCTLLRVLHRRGQPEARQLYACEAMAVLRMFGLGQTDVAHALGELPDVAPLQAALNAILIVPDDSFSGSLWPLFERVMAFALAWDDHLEGHPVLSGAAREVRRSGKQDLLDLADGIVVHAEQGAALGEQLAQLLVERWGADPVASVTLAEVIVAEPDLAVGCLYF